MKRLDVLLVNPNNRKETYQGLANEFTAVEPPIWPGMIASFLRKKGVKTDILDTNFEQLGHKDSADAISQINPRLVAIICYGHQPSASTLVMEGAGALALELKQSRPDLPIIFIGGHPAALPERTLKEEACDFVCAGEGLYTLADLTAALRDSPNNWSKAKLENVRGVLFERDGQIVHTPSAPLVLNLDEEIPGVAWDLMDANRYKAHNWLCFDDLKKRDGYASIYSSLGCPFSCDFCCIQAPFRSGEKVSGKKRSYRHWSAATVLKQFDILVNHYGVRNYRMADELFLVNSPVVREILEGLIARNYDLNIFAYTRLDTYTPELLDLARKAGITWLSLTIESANDRVLKSAHKGTNVNMAVKSREDFKNAGINANANLIFGLPEDNRETMQETLKLAQDLNCEFVNMYAAMAYPGSKLYDQAVSEGWRLPPNWNAYSQHSYDSLPLDTKYISGEEVLTFRDDAFHTYFTNPAYLNMMAEKFGQETREHLERMTSYRLPRRHTKRGEGTEA